MVTLALQNRREMTEYLKNSGFNERQIRTLMRAVKDVLSALDLPTRKDWEKLDERTQKLYDDFEEFRKTFHKRLQKALADAKKDLKQGVEEDIKEDAKEREKKAEDHNKERYDNLLRHIESLRDTAQDLRERWIRDMGTLRGEVQRSDKESKKRDEESKKRDEKLSGDIDTLRGEVQRVADESKKRDDKIENRNEKRHDQLFQLLVRTQDMVRVQYERGIDQRVSFLERWLLRWFKTLRNLWTHLKP